MTLKIGNIIEIPTSKGLAYAQYTHRAPNLGYIIRVLPGFFTERPANLQALAQKEHVFVTIFPLYAAIRRKKMHIVGNTEVPEYASSFPLFRAAGKRDKSGKVHNWWLWDGEREWYIGDLEKEQLKLPIKGIPNDIALVEMIEEGWTPETDWWMAVPK